MSINPDYQTDAFKQIFQDTIQGKSETSQPFPHFSLRDFVQDAALLQGVTSELKTLEWHHKDNDLLSLEQTDDLSNLEAEQFPNLVKYRDWVRQELKPWVERMSGIALGEQIDLTGSLYSYTDLLLPHDDQLEGRKFAFILYFSDLAPEDGGSLKLFNSDESNCPTTVAKEVQPQRNLFNMFLVSARSWHMVSEVKQDGAARYSINGWFHASDVELTHSPTVTHLVAQPLHMNVELEEVTQWLNEEHVSQTYHSQMQEVFEDESAIEIPRLLKNEKYEQVLAALEHCAFERQGPPHQREVWRLKEDELEPTHCVAVMMRLFRSAAIGVLLSQWTGLPVHPCLDDAVPAKRSRSDTDATEPNYDDVRIAVNLHRFQAGCYSMVDDQIAQISAFVGSCLEMRMFLLPNEWHEEDGGFLSLMAGFDEDEVFRIVPEANKAALFYRESDVFPFVKYVNQRAGDRHFYMLSCTVQGIDGSRDSTDCSDSD